MVVLTANDIENLRKASEGVCPKAFDAFSNFQKYLIKNPLVRFNSHQFDQLKKGLQSLQDRYPKEKLGQLTKLVIDRIARSENQLKMTELEKKVLNQLEQLSKD